MNKINFEKLFSTLDEASGEDESHDSDISDESRTATVQGVKVKYKSNAQIPPIMVEGRVGKMEF